MSPATRPAGKPTGPRAVERCHQVAALLEGRLLCRRLHTMNGTEAARPCYWPQIRALGSWQTTGRAGARLPIKIHVQ